MKKFASLFPLVRTRLIALVLAPALFVPCACDGNPGDGDGDVDDEITDEARFIETYADIVHQSYLDALDTVGTLDAEVDMFLFDPSIESMVAARQSWLLARNPYMHAEIARIEGGPMDSEMERLVNAWPLDESYIDYVADAPGVGIINDLHAYPDLTPEVLRAANAASNPSKVALGYHAIEFLLWGQDTSADAAGTRPFTDYVVDEFDDSATAANQERRASYLRMATVLLAEDLQVLADAWAPGSDNFRKLLLQQPSQDALATILHGMWSLSAEGLVHENLSMAYDTQDEEYEQSCFSDNTHNDLQYGQSGIESVYYGSYGDVSGVGLAHLVAERDEKLDQQMKDRMMAVSDAIDDIGPPFDQAIVARRDKVAAAITALEAQAETIREIAKLLDVSID